MPWTFGTLGPLGLCCAVIGLLCLVSHTQGACYYKGMQYSNNTVWETDACTTCSCLGDMVVCQHKKCQNPNCNFARGERLRIAPNKCCPDCATSVGSCEYEGEVVGHNTAWDSSPCTQCYCNNGISTCSNQTCPTLRCQNGEYSQQLEGDCCPSCIRGGRSCTYHGTTYRDGQEWSPVKCTKCICEDGTSQCFVADCPALFCGQHEEVAVLPGHCCPECVGRPCDVDGKTYTNNQQWQQDQCTYCKCYSGIVECTQERCLENLICPANERAVTREGHCCPECVSIQAPCEFEGTMRFHRDVWNISACEFCICDSGNVQCSTSECDRLTCREGETQIHKEGRCCPECTQPSGYCIQNRVSYTDGESWDPDQCTSCSCTSGDIDCYRVNCPPCSVGTVPVAIGGQCCPDCVAVQCPAECKSCDGQGCTSCRPGKLLEQSRCVDTCNQGFFQSSDTQCQACHYSCISCTASTEHHCTSCRPNEFIKWGRCVPECGLGFYELNGECLECEQSCLECSGPRKSDCISCANSTNVILRSRCVTECGVGYYLRDNICYQCDQSCATCHHDSNRCMTCQPQSYLQDGRCVQRCGAGFFQASSSHCEACHDTCLYCSGPSITQCAACQSPALLQDGRCLGNCSHGYFDQSGVCQSCHRSCRTCKGPTDKECTSCREASQLVQGKPPFGDLIHGTCVRTCLDGYYPNTHGICMACNPTCLECSATSIDACTSCRAPLVLRQGYCVRQCGDGQYEINSLCLDCHPSCSMCSGPGVDECTSCTGGYAPQGGRCPTGCPFSQFSNTLGVCQSCDSQCGSCFPNRAGRGSLCTECVDGAVYPLGDTCVPDCGVGYHLDDQNTCRECHSSCRTCFSSGVYECSSCYSGHVLTHNRMCADRCYGGYYDNNGVCEPCPDGCLECVDPYECTVCRSPNDVLQFGTCSRSCAEQYFLDPETRICRECDWSCNACNGPTANDCVQCMGGLRLRDGACVSNCDQGYYEANGMCKVCDAECSTCSGPGVCRSCDPPRLLLGDECVMHCGSGFVNDYSTHTCRECPLNCAECSTPDQCTSCYAGTFLLRGQCALECGRNYFSDHINNVCELNVYPPNIYVNGSITSDIGGTTIIDTSFLTAFDPDTAPDHLRFIVLSPPTNGELIKIVRGQDIFLQAGDSFTYDELDEDSIRFVHNPKSALLGFMSLKVNDRQFDSQVHDIGILVVSPEPPYVTRNQPLIIEEGDYGQISSGLNLQIQDKDNPESVTITRIEGPNHGRLLKYPDRVKSNIFTLDDLRMGNIRYAHDGSETEHDAIVFQVTDGHNVINVLFAIQILPQDNQGPILVNNILARVREGEMVPITNNLLSARDGDSSDAELVYTLTPPAQNPRNGDVLMVVAIPNEGLPDGWQDLGNGLMSKRLMRFRQRDIDEGRVYYKHFGMEGTSDYFMFEISDTANPPNVLSDQAFNFEVFPSNDEPPRLVQGISTPIIMVVLEGQISPITRSHLAFTDPDSPDQELVYNITQPLLRGQGTIEHLDRPYSPLELFTQADLNAEKVVYRSPPTEVGSIQQRYQFMFTVSDSVPGGNQVGPLPFIVTIVPVNNAAPTFSNPNPKLTVERGKLINIRPYLTDVTDLDTPLHDLIYSIVKEPEFGYIYKNGYEHLVRGDEFTHQELLRDSFHYYHDASAATADDFQVAISDGSHTNTITLLVSTLFPDVSSPTVDTTASLSLYVPEGSLATISREHLFFMDDDSIDSEIIIKLHSTPKRGIIQKQVTGDQYVDLGLGDTFTQQDIESYNIRYIADEEVGSQPLGDLIYFNITDANGNTLDKQVFSITITPVNDQPPQVTVVNSILAVEGTTEPITSFDIRVSDLDTRLNQLTVVVDSPPSFGHLENIKSPQGSEFNQGIPITSFRVQDLIDNVIYYVQDIHRNIEPIQDGFLFHVNDGDNDSPQYRFNITIQLTNDEEPSLITTQLFLPEGEGVVASNVTLYVSDLDTPDEDLIFSITQYPSFGNLRRRDHLESAMHTGRILRPQDQFTYEDVLEELIVYIHDGSDVEHDSFSVSVTDGVFTAVNTVNIVIGLMNDETPRMTVNRGLRVQMDTTTPITQEDLLATDVDSDNKQLLYTVTADPNVGHLGYSKNAKEFVVSSEGPKSTFTQTDIDNGYVKYVHSAEDSAGTVVFKFTLSDPEGNQLIDQSFLITVIEDRVPPRVVSNEGLILDEGSAKIISTDLLSSTDVDSQPGDLQYFISSPPEQGHLEHSSFPGVPLLQFSQGDLAARSISYVHTSEAEASMDRFTFSVNDGNNQITQVFYITITPVDDSLPLVTNLGMRVQEGIRKTITEFELKGIDQDTPEDQVMFTIFHEPVHGTIDFTTNERRYAPTVTFTMADIYENRISYNHDGSNTLEDSFAFTVSDGTNPVFLVEQNTELVTTSTPQVFSIIVLPVDDGTPRIVTNFGLDYLEYVDDRAMRALTERVLQTMDQDTPDNLLVYTITSPPDHGILESTLTPGIPLAEFTQEDINSGVIRYVLNQGAEMEETDRFVFDVADSKPNTVLGNVFRISWPLVHFENIHYNVSETAGYVSVNVKRTGNLNQNVFVMCHTRAATATSSGLRPGQHDFVEHAGQVQFEEREDTKTCTVVINNDGIFEGPIGEDFLLELSMPTFALLGDPSLTVVTIMDPEDEPSLEFEKNLYHVNESSGFIFAPVIRKGDTSGSVSVVCFTVSGTARGSTLTGLESGSDFKTRGMTMENTVVFPPGVLKASCDVKIIDDAIFEQQEEFEIALAMPSMMTKIGETARATIIIDGPNDASLIHLGAAQYVFSENSGTVDIEVIRSGSDLAHTSMVWCAPKPLQPPSAYPGVDFVPSASQLTFAPQQTVEVCRITIIDDTASPQVEGDESFVVYLSSAMGSGLAPPSEALIVINDTEDDIPTMQFAYTKVKVEEKAGVVHIPIIRNGDLSFESSVRCYTRQRSAQVMMDFDERRNVDDFRVVFLPGDKVKNCTVGIVEDNTYEADEIFHVKLGDPQGNEFCDGRVGKNDTATITIVDKEDAPTLQFERMAYSVREPSGPIEPSVITITVLRSGDQNRTSKVRVSTRDGSAKSGVDYEPYSKMLKFLPGVTSMDIQVEILYNKDMEWHETFSVVLGPDEPFNALLGDATVATVTIIDEEASGSVVLPAPPIVISLMDYDDVHGALDNDPSPGYPLICVTPCDPHYPKYTLTRAMCTDSGINMTNIQYNWEVAMPTDNAGARAPFERIVDSTPYTSCNHHVLDSVYFSRRFHVRCVAQPHDKSGRPGVPLRSNIVTIGTDNGICHTPVTSGSMRGFQAQSFIANLQYLDPTHEHHPNTIHISVEIPHEDGMLPVISTMPIHNIRLLLTEPVYRHQHICSNMITNSTLGGLADYSFLEPILYENIEIGPGLDYPYQFDPSVREDKTLGIYKNLNLKSCTWNFDAYYHMTELIDLCGGEVTSDFEVRNAGQSHLTVTVPLYVSYIYVTAPTGWAALDHRTEMEFSFFYSTILWRTGLETDSVLSGRLQILRIRIGEKGNLIVDFKTTTKFRGRFVMDHHTLPDYESRVLPPSILGVDFDLELLWTENSFDSPQQLWRATSSYNLKDYSGDYIIELLPCTVTPTQSFNVEPNSPVVCTAHPPEKFVVPVAFQQTNRPVPVVYSLNTEFHLMNNEKVFMMNPNEATMALQEMDYKGAFSKGQTIFGRVLWNPDQDLDEAYKLQIEKLYICTGTDGFIPYYDPTGNLYDEGPQLGCMQQSKNLKSRFLLLDREDPTAINPSYNSVPFGAEFAHNSESYTVINNMPGVDGFTMSVDPLYKVNSGHQWFMQVIYTIGPSDSLPRGRRSLMAAVPFGAHSIQSNKAGRNGTNMKALMLNESQLGKDEGVAIIASTIVGILFAIIILAVLIIIVGKRRRRQRDKMASEKYNNPIHGDISSPNNKNRGEVELNLHKTVKVSTVNLNKQDNDLGINDDLGINIATANSHHGNRQDVKVKKINLEVKVQNSHTGEGGTEV